MKLNVDRSKCIKCGGCVSCCPVEAISFVEIDGKKAAHIDEDKCIRCYSCAGICPVEAIQEVD